MTDKDIKNLFIVDSDSYTKEKIQAFAHKAIAHGKISKKGEILFENHGLSPDEKLKLALAIRIIAHNFDSSISESLKFKELCKVLFSEAKEAVGSRLSKLVTSGYAKKDGYGIYSAYVHRIEAFLNELNDPERSVHRSTPKRKPSAKKNMPLTGVGKDIQSLVDGGFFKTPKTVIDVKKKLEEEVRFHDVRVVDSTIRNTFVVNKKILKRIPYEGKGKAKWQYVIR